MFRRYPPVVASWEWKKRMILDVGGDEVGSCAGLPERAYPNPVLPDVFV